MVYLHQDGKLGDLIRIQMDQHQQVIGSQHHFLSLSSNDYLYSKPSRIQYPREQNTKWGITLHIDKAWNQGKTREHDEFLMDKIVHKIKQKHPLERINDVRLYLKISRLSDIVTDDGTRIQHLAMHGSVQTSTLK